jgi:hypothetical protein
MTATTSSPPYSMTGERPGRRAGSSGSDTMTEDDIARLSVLVSEGHKRLRRCTGTLRSCRQASQKKPSDGCCGTRPRTRRPFTPVVQYMGCAGRSTPTSTTGSTDICSNSHQLVVGDPRARRPR